MARRRKLGERSVRRCHGLLTAAAAAEKTMSEVRIEAEIHTRRARRKPTYLPADYLFIKHEFNVELTSDNIQLNISDSEFRCIETKMEETGKLHRCQHFCSFIIVGRVGANG